MFKKLILFSIFAFNCSSGSYAEPTTSLNFALQTINGAQRSIFNKLLDDFQKQNPNILINFKSVEAGQYKQEVETYLNAQKDYDVLFWFGGERLNYFIGKNLIEPITTLWSKNSWNSNFTKSSISAVTNGKEIYGLPIHYYHWGIYYNKKIFARLKLSPPKNFADLDLLCRSLNKAGVPPFVIGAKDHWTLGGWFDYLDLRINGLDFHKKLLDGKISFQDPKVKKLFLTWKDWINSHYFTTASSQLDWRAAIPYLYREEAAMMLMGNFWTSQLPANMESNIEFFPFPIDSRKQIFEDAPTDVLIISKNSKNKAAAEKLIQFFARPEVQAELNEGVHLISPIKAVSSTKDHFLIEGKKLLNRANGLAQYFDRDSSPEFAEKALNLIYDFFANPAKLDSTLKELEELRQKIN